MEQSIAVAGDALTITLNEATELRALRREDADDLFSLVGSNYNRLHRWLAWSKLTYSIDDTHRFLEQAAGENESGDGLVLGIFHNSKLSGAIGLHRIDRRNQLSSIGYWIDASLEGKGIVTAACRAVVNEGFTRFGLHRIEIRCATWNHRSSAIPRRLGFVEEGILREAEFVGGKWFDLRVFSMLAQDWRAI